MNAAGNDIYIRPAGSVGLVLVDDLKAHALAQLKRDGLAPAVVVETSPANYQAWLRVSQEPIPPEQATAAARILATRYGGDIASADFRHYGRLAGFTNRKPQHRQANGQFPYVLLRGASGTLATNAAALLSEATTHLSSPQVARKDHLVPPPTYRVGGDKTPGETYAFYATRIIARYPSTDASRLDWMVCRDIASASLAVDEHYLEQALLEGSPRLAERKAGHVENYVAHTARKVMSNAHVIAARLAQEQAVGSEQSSELL